MNLFLLAGGSVVGKAVDFAISPYPPSFDNEPMVFGWALFARLLITSLSAATLVRLYTRNRQENLAANHPVFYHRAVTMCFLTAAMLGASSDVITYLFWGEVTNATIAIVLLIAQILNATTMIPFLMALFVPIWLGWLRHAGIVKTAPSITLNGVVNDVRVTWQSAHLPVQLFCYSAIGSAIVTVGKYARWAGYELF